MTRSEAKAVLKELKSPKDTAEAKIGARSYQIERVEKDRYLIHDTLGLWKIAEVDKATLVETLMGIKPVKNLQWQ